MGLAAAIHRAADDFESAHRRPVMDAAFLIDMPVAALRPLMSQRSGDWRYVEAEIGRLRGLLNATGSDLDWGVCLWCVPGL